MFWSTLGMLGFSVTLPATRVAVPALGAITVGLGRAVVAGFLAAGLLLWRREPLPSRAQLGQLVLVALGVVVGFPLLSAWALLTTPASHAAMVTGLAPLSTAIFAVVRARERTTARFWLASLVGTAAVLLCSAARDVHGLALGDALLLGAAAIVGLGYAEGARLARTMGGSIVISWALVIALPVLLPIVALRFEPAMLHAPGVAWAGLAYVSVVSMFFAFFAWYRGLAQAGIARASQVQLFAPLISAVWCALLLGEAVPAATWIGMVVVGASLLVARRRRA